MKNKQECLRVRIYKYYADNQSERKKYMLNHFRCKDFYKSTIYRVIECAENKSDYERSPGSGRIAGIMSTKNI